MPIPRYMGVPCCKGVGCDIWGGRPSSTEEYLDGGETCYLIGAFTLKPNDEGGLLQPGKD